MSIVPQGLGDSVTENAMKPSTRKQDSHELAIKYAGLDDEAVISLVLAENKPSANAFIRGIWIAVGSLFVAFAGIGVIVPGMPTTSWLVAAAYCYGRSSQKLFRWLLTNRAFGNSLLGYYRSGKALPFHSKIIICGFIGLISASSIWLVTKAGDPGFGQITILIVAILGIWWVGWRVPTTE
ncbi:MAG TPA: YbaN family protein [Poseidonia sp.]|nr:YbaN family protein [Poseidonia sp.]